MHRYHIFVWQCDGLIGLTHKKAQLAHISINQLLGKEHFTPISKAYIKAKSYSHAHATISASSISILS